MITKLPKLIIYDWDNTIVDTAKIIGKVINRLRVYLGKSEINEMEILRCVGDPNCDWVNELFDKKSIENQRLYTEYYTELHNKDYDLKLLPYATEIMHFASKNSIKQAILTNKDTAICVSECEKLNLNHAFFMIIGKDEMYPKAKPDTIGLEIICDEYNEIFSEILNKDDILYIGDTLIDLECAKNYGCKFAFVGEENWINKDCMKNIDIQGNLLSVINILTKLC